MSFTPVEPIIADSITVTISGQETVPTLSGDTYTATITLDGTEPSGILSFTIDFVDRAGNPGTQRITTTDDSFVNHDTGPPETVFTGIYSSNTDSSWAKVGDTVYVRFTANEPLNDCTMIIGGNNSTVSNPSSTTYVKHYYARMNSYNEGDQSTDGFCSGYANTTSAVDAVTFKMIGDHNFDGVIQMYGIS